MTRLKQAMLLANERKVAATGVTDDESTRMVMGTSFSDRAVFGGFDIGFDELVGTSLEVGEFYSQSAHTLGLRSLFVSSWCDGLLTGLLLASLPPTSESGDTDVTGSEGGNVRECIEGLPVGGPDGPVWCMAHNQPYVTCDGTEKP